MKLKIKLPAQLKHISPSFIMPLVAHCNINKMDIHNHFEILIFPKEVDALFGTCKMKMPFSWKQIGYELLKRFRDKIFLYILMCRFYIVEGHCTITVATRNRFHAFQYVINGLLREHSNTYWTNLFNSENRCQATKTS